MASIPINHVGPIPGVPVGTVWSTRTEVSRAKVHRPVMGGIHGRGMEGAFSVILCGIDGDIDNGGIIIYTGINSDKLVRGNLSLACSCAAGFNEEKGADAEWRWAQGQDIRVVRKNTKKSVFAPQYGFRYDGIYKVSKYFKIKNEEGGAAWKFVLCRNDDAPAPWLATLPQPNLPQPEPPVGQSPWDGFKTEEVDLGVFVLNPQESNCCSQVAEIQPDLPQSNPPIEHSPWDDFKMEEVDSGVSEPILLESGRQPEPLQLDLLQPDPLQGNPPQPNPPIGRTIDEVARGVSSDVVGVVVRI